MLASSSRGTLASPSLRTIASLSFIIGLKVAIIVWIRGALSSHSLSKPHKHSFIDTDYPRTWPIPEPSPVRMFIEDSTHYQMDSDDPNADSEWGDALTPGDGLIYLGEERQPYSVSMFHQLRCLNIFRLEMVRLARGAEEGASPKADADSRAASELAQHCLNYLRQMVLCRADTGLDPLLGRPRVEAYPDVYQCRDWDAVYREVEKNQKAYLQWKLLP